VSSSIVKKARMTCISWANSYFFDTICKLCGFVPPHIFVQPVWCVQNARQVEWSTWNAVASMTLHNCVSNKKESSLKPTACNLWIKLFLNCASWVFYVQRNIVSCTRNVNTSSTILAAWYNYSVWQGVFCGGRRFNVAGNVKTLT